MLNFFGGGGNKKDKMKKQVRQNHRNLRRGEREMDREIQNSMREERNYQAQIKQCLRKGDKATAKILAQNIVRLRKNRERLQKSKGQMKSVGFQTANMATTAKIADSMKTASGVMQNMNQQMNMNQVANTMKTFQKETSKAEMQESLMDDMFDDMFTGEMETETNDAVSQVLDEIGIDTQNRLSSVQVGNSNLMAKQQVKKSVTDNEVDDLLASLQIPTQ